MSRKQHGNNAKIRKNKDISSLYEFNNIISREIAPDGTLTPPSLDTVKAAKKEVDNNEK